MCVLHFSFCSKKRQLPFNLLPLICCLLLTACGGYYKQPSAAHKYTHTHAHTCIKADVFVSRYVFLYWTCAAGCMQHVSYMYVVFVGDDLSAAASATTCIYCCHKTAQLANGSSSKDEGNRKKQQLLKKKNKNDNYYVIWS